MKNRIEQRQFFGTVTMGERGQAVIPSEARKIMGLKQGEKLLVFGMGSEMLVLAKLSHVEKLASRLSSQLGTMTKAIRHAAGEK
ncbi:MAG: AbrB/MazE/SpoVT family DNA-binding domain-containing protein [Patescibacteria group bacterium]|nr:AbrB/MazE/SpoVT family DNA-binding domain-containing protein [Patescibacteria group bacterium]